MDVSGSRTVPDFPALSFVFSPPPCSVFSSTLLEQSKEEPHALASHPQHDGSMQMFLFGNGLRTCLVSHEACDLIRCKVLCPTLEIFVPKNCQEQKIENCQEYDGIKKWSQMNVAW